MRKSKLTWTDDGNRGSFTLDGHDLTQDIARRGLSISTSEKGVQAEVRLLSRALDVTVEAERVILHTTAAQEALLQAAGWAKKGDVSVHGDLLWAQVSILEVAAEGITDERLATSVREVAARLRAFVQPDLPTTDEQDR